MKKEITIQGTERTVTGYVVIKMNARSENVEVHNRSTHDEELRRRTYHTVEAQIEGKRIDSWETHIETAIPSGVKAIEQSLIRSLTDLANVKPQKPIFEQLKAMGYE